MHLVAAGCLFVGGGFTEALTEALRLCDLFRTWASVPGRNLRKVFRNDPVMITGQGHAAIGPILPFLIICLLMNLLVIGRHGLADTACSVRGVHSECDLMVAQRGEVLFSPVAAAYLLPSA